MDEKTKKVFTRRWNCFVVSTGYHNGARCDERYPHGSEWNCGYRYIAVLTQKQWENLNNE